MKRLLIALLFILWITVPITAQDSEIAVGDVISGEVTDEVYSFLYTFEAEAGDAIVFEMLGIEPTREGLDDPELVILGLEREVLVTTDGMFQEMGGFGAAYLGFVAPDSGRFGVIATRKDAVDGDAVGNFELRMFKPEIIQPGKPIEGSITSEDTHQFYVFVPEDSAFTLEYQRLSGDYSPEVSVNALNDKGELIGLGYLNGANLTVGTLGEFEEEVPYFIIIGEQTLGFGDFMINTTTADYTLAVSLSK